MCVCAHAPGQKFTGACIVRSPFMCLCACRGGFLLLFSHQGACEERFTVSSYGAFPPFLPPDVSLGAETKRCRRMNSFRPRSLSYSPHATVESTPACVYENSRRVLLHTLGRPIEIFCSRHRCLPSNNEHNQSRWDR